MLVRLIQAIVRLVRETSQTSSPPRPGRTQEQRDPSSMAEFVRLLRDHDNRVNG